MVDSIPSDDGNDGNQGWGRGVWGGGGMTSTSCSNWMTTGRPPIPLARVGRLIREEEKEAGTFPHCGIEILCLFSSLCPLHPNLLVSFCLFFFYLGRRRSLAVSGSVAFCLVSSDG